MARGGPKLCASMGAGVCNPYPRPKQVEPEYYECESCDRFIKSKDWRAHKSSRSHQKKEAAKYAPEKKDAADNGHFESAPAENDPRACHNCGESGHRKFECPNPPKGRPGLKCFNCHEEGHSKADCTNPRVMVCRNCEKRMCSLITVLPLLTLFSRPHRQGLSRAKGLEQGQVHQL